MKHEKLFDLQLFAEDPAAETNTDPANDPEETNNEPQSKPDPRTLPKYSDEDLDRIVSGRLNRWQKEQEKKTSEAERLGKMSAEEKANERLNALESQLKEYKTREARAEMMKEARAILQDKKLHVNDALLSNLIAEDAETTKENVETFYKLVSDLVDNAVKDRVKSEPPRKGAPPAGLTKEQILKVQDRAERQRLIEENIDLFR